MRALVLAALLVPTAAHAEVVGKGLRAGVVTFSMRRRPSHNDASAIGSTSRNSQRQCR